MIVTDAQAEAAFAYLNDSAADAAQAAADRAHLTEFRKAKLALLASEFNDGSEAERDRRARAHPEYVALLKGLHEAVYRDEMHRHKTASARLTLDVWRTSQANLRSTGSVR